MMTRLTMPTWIRGALAFALLFGLAGCGAFRENLGLTKKTPDEFAVVSRAPLVLPPNYKLRPPRPGTRRPQAAEPVQKARTALFRSGGTPGQARALTSGDNASVGETALLDRAGSDGVEPDIRRIINEEGASLADKNRSLTERLIFWQDREAPGKIVDARREAARIRDTQATGQAPTAGTTPVIQRRKKGLLEDLF